MKKASNIYIYIEREREHILITITHYISKTVKANLRQRALTCTNNTTIQFYSSLYAIKTA